MNPEEFKALKRRRTELKREMKERGIRRTSCFNGGLSSEEYRANSELFRLNTLIGK